MSGSLLNFGNIEVRGEKREQSDVLHVGGRPDQRQAHQGANDGWQGFFAALEQILARIG